MKINSILCCCIVLIALGVSTAANATSEARVKAPDWGSERVLSYAIYQPAIGRIATAYYRIVQSEYEGRPVYEIRYNGSGSGLSESSVCLVDAVTLEPYKSARKLKTQSDVFFIDTYYGDGRIVVRRKQGTDGEIIESSQDFPGRIFDYEELMWLIPALDFSADDRLHFALFSTVGDQTILVVVRNMGEDTFTFHDKEHKATLYTFALNTIRQNMWVQDLHGIPTVVKYDTGETVLYNLDLLKDAEAKPAPEPPAEEEAAAPPPEEPADEGEGEGEEGDGEGDGGGEEPPYIPF